ncbi:MAG: tripartite tricarboxylate transporter substrate-binding protein [Alphaproteobacteria bacterium]|nr:tripartite tricarboxylate transporter substrate-binding protein [Alphaproteobacteria bacterium]
MQRRALLLTPLLPMAAQAFPLRPVTLIVPFAPGGNTDVVARIIQAPLSGVLGQPVVIENRAGAGGALGSEVARRAPADGHVLLLATASTHGANPALFDDLPYDPLADFAHVTLLGVTPVLLVVPPALGVADLDSLFALLRREPGRHNYASAGVGSLTHLVGEWLRMAARLDIQHIPYRGGGPALEAVVKGEVTLLLEPSATLAGAIRDGQVRALAVATRHPSRIFPALPTLHDSGLADFNAATWTMLLAPNGTPQAALERLDAAMQQVLRMPEVATRLAAAGVEVAEQVAGPAARAFMAQDIARWRHVVREAGIRVTR